MSLNKFIIVLIAMVGALGIRHYWASTHSEETAIAIEKAPERSAHQDTAYLKDIDALEITFNGGRIEFERMSGSWMIKELEYPASSRRLDRLLVQLHFIDEMQAIYPEEADLKEIGLSEESLGERTTIIRLKVNGVERKKYVLGAAEKPKNNKDTLTAVKYGENVVARRFVSITENTQTRVFLTDDNLFSFKNSVAKWIEPTIFKRNKKLAEVSLIEKGGVQWTIKRDSLTRYFANQKNGKMLDSESSKKAGETFSPYGLSRSFSVLPSKNEEVQFNDSYAVEATDFSGVTYRAEISRTPCDFKYSTHDDEDIGITGAIEDLGDVRFAYAKFSVTPPVDEYDLRYRTELTDEVLTDYREKVKDRVFIVNLGNFETLNNKIN